MAIDPTEEILTAGLDWDSDMSTWRWVQATEALIEAGVDRPTRGDALKAASFIRKRNGDQGRRYAGRRELLTPQKKINFSF